MKQLESQNEKLAHRARYFFLPNLAETLLFLLLAVIFLIFYNTNTVVSHLDNTTLSAASSLKAHYSTFASGFSNAFSQALGGRLGQILLWGFIGALVYIGVWLSKNVLTSFENDVISDKYLHPSSFKEVNYWSSTLSVKVFLLADVLIIFAYTFVLLKAAIPSFAALTASAAYNFRWSASPLYILVCTLATAVLLYGLLLLLKFTGHLWRLL